MAATTALLMLLLGQSTPAKIQVGDRLRVVVVEDDRYNGEYTVLTDGSITGVGFGRIVVAGKSAVEAQEMVRKGLLKILKSPTVSLVLAEQKKRFVFVTSPSGSAPGPIDFEPGMDVRRIITGVPMPEANDLYSVRLFRNGQLIGTDRLDRVLQGVGELGGTGLQANDVVTIAEVSQLRIYVSGQVTKPGEFRVQEGTDAIQAIALAGGANEEAKLEIAYTVKVRRGASVFEVSDSPSAERFVLQAGDTVVVEVPAQIRVSVGGDVETPGEFTMRERSELFAAIQRGGGLTPEGSMADILVVRSGQSYLVDLSGFREGQEAKGFALQDGDQVFVRRNERRILVLGYVKEPKPIRMEENREYSLADVVAEAGGPDARGTYHRVYLGRRDESGKIQVKEYRLGAFIKDGDLTQNPVLMAGDVVMVGESKGISLAQAGSLLSNALILDSLFRR